MKKILMIAVAMIFSMTLFAQDKMVVDEKAAKEIEKLKTALESAGMEFDLGAFIPESEQNKVEDAVSVDEYVEIIESNSLMLTTYISALALIPMYQYYLIGGVWVLKWNGKISSSPSIVGDDWDGVIHTRENTLGTVYETHTVHAPSYAYQWDNIPTSTPKLCAQLFVNNNVYIPGFGWVVLPAPFGSKVCGTVNFNW